MLDVLPVDIEGLVTEGLLSQRRPEDGLLHCSSDLVGSLRHTQLRLAGAPSKKSILVDQIRMHTGTMWHTWLGGLLTHHGHHYMREIKVDAGLPGIWSGTADWLFRHHSLDGYVLGDLKTSKGESMIYVDREGMKENHYYQLSAYYWGLVEMGFPMVDRMFIFYLPMNNVQGQMIVPKLAVEKPLPQEELWEIMQSRETMVNTYLTSLPDTNAPDWKLGTTYSKELENSWLLYVNKNLAPTMERVQKVVWNANQKVFDVRLTPHWLTKFCPYESALCDCSKQGVTKIGHYLLSGEYVPRKGYTDYQPEVEPTKKEYGYRRKDGK